MTRPNYIFIVGMDRSGSTLTRNILNCSQDIGLGGEAQYFRRRPHWSFLPDHGHRILFKKMGDFSTDEGAKRLIHYLFCDPKELSNFWCFSKNNFDREEFMCKFLKTDRSERALLDLALQFHSRAKPIRGEKTPANIFFVPTLMAWFSNAKIIHTFRDPRAIFVSRGNKKARRPLPRINRMVRRSSLVFELYAGSRVALEWQQTIRLHRHYKKEYPGQYYLSKYEDLVLNPQNAIRSLCNFLDVDITPEMLQPKISNSSLVSRDDPPSGFDRSAIDRWRKHIHPLILNWITFCCKKQLLEHNYPL